MLEMWTLDCTTALLFMSTVIVARVVVVVVVVVFTLNKTRSALPNDIFIHQYRICTYS